MLLVRLFAEGFPAPWFRGKILAGNAEFQERSPIQNVSQSESASKRFSERRIRP
jgi:hypothetical protein